MNLISYLYDVGANLVETKKYGRFALFTLGLLLAFATSIFLFWVLLDLAIAHLDFLLLVVGIPVGCVFGISYLLHRHAPAPVPVVASDAAALTAKGEEFHPVMRDAAYLVEQDVADYTPVIRPSHLSAVESAHRFRIQDGVIVHDFVAPISSPVDAKALREQIQRHLAQRLRSRELPGFTAEVFVSKSGRPYCIIQCLSVVDFGDFVQISLVFADETAVTLLEAKERARLEYQAQPNYRDPML